MIFNTDEQFFILSSIETYNDLPRGVFPASIQRQFAETITKKLNNLSPLTFFSKQEYSFMALCVHHNIGKLNKQYVIIDSDIIALRDRLLELAEPSDT